MFALAHVILPFSEQPMGEAIVQSLARFQKSGRDDLPKDWVRFEDQTASVRQLHETRVTFTRAPHLRRTGGPEMELLDGDALLAEMISRDLTTWTVRLADVEPNLDRFAGRFVHGLVQHPVTGGWGRWRNSAGRWDWWDLGGRFDGAITGFESNAERTWATISSGRSMGRNILEGLENGFARAAGREPPTPVDIRADVNVELVSVLRDDLYDGLTESLPSGLVLPPGAVADEIRWVGTWPSVDPGQNEPAIAALEALGLMPGAEWREVVMFVYDRFADHWAAGVSFHF